MVVRVDNKIVVEIVPDYALPVEKYYSAEFCSQCVDAPDGVEQGWIYNPDSGSFSEPEPEPEPEATDTEVLNALLGVSE